MEAALLKSQENAEQLQSKLETAEKQVPVLPVWLSTLQAYVERLTLRGISEVPVGSSSVSGSQLLTRRKEMTPCIYTRTARCEEAILLWQAMHLFVSVPIYLFLFHFSCEPVGSAVGPPIRNQNAPNYYANPVY